MRVIESIVEFLKTLFGPSHGSEASSDTESSSGTPKGHGGKHGSGHNQKAPKPAPSTPVDSDGGGGGFVGGGDEPAGEPQPTPSNPSISDPTLQPIPKPNLSQLMIAGVKGLSNTYEMMGKSIRAQRVTESRRNHYLAQHQAKVRAYQRRMKNGKTVSVRGHQRHTGTPKKPTAKYKRSKK